MVKLKRTRKSLWSRSLQRTLTSMTRSAVRAGSRAVTQAIRAAPKVRQAGPAKSKPLASTQWVSGLAVGGAGARRYWLYKPPGVRRTERLPLMVMLHGCDQNAEALAASTRMNRVAARERFLVLYPEQDRFSNVQGCWNWYDTRSGRAQGEASSIDAAIDQVCQLYPVDAGRIALAGLSAGAGMAALMASRRPERFRAVAMHSGIAPGVAHSPTTALVAMGGRMGSPTPGPATTPLPPLLVIQGTADFVVAPKNGADAARQWAARMGAKPSASRVVKRGARYAATMTDYRSRGRIIATLCEISGLGHAWSGGAAGHPYSDPKGPDASRMIWAFAAKQFAVK